jgi:cytochrome P450
MKDVVIRGKEIKKGEKIAVWYISGNRDEDVFDRPHEIVIDRPNVRSHLSFGFGIHRCLGNRLAELQLRVAWEEILKRFKCVYLDGDPVRVHSHAIMGYSDLPVQVRRY